jgi:prepilin-type N-terminal cleavage/methylation domain-containing protein
MKIEQKGFTLFELLVSISIIAILVALATTSYSAAQKKARDARRMEDMESIRKAQEQWYMLNNATYSIDCVSGHNWTAGSQLVLAAVPKDPKDIAPNVYSFSCPAGGASYCICATLENNTGNSSAVTCAAGTWLTGTGAYYCVTNQQ